MFWPCETRTSTCRNFATISSGLYRFLAITVLLDVEDIPQVGPLQWGWIIAARSFWRIAVAPVMRTSVNERGTSVEITGSDAFDGLQTRLNKLMSLPVVLADLNHA